MDTNSLVTEIRARPTMEGGEGLLAIIIDGSIGAPPGINFLSNRESSLQVGLLNHASDTVIEPHIHKCIDRHTKETQEVLIVRAGILQITFYESDGYELPTRILYAGDIVYLMRGGHSLKMITDCDILEIKVGPYFGKEADKTPLFSRGKDE